MKTALFLLTLVSFAGLSCSKGSAADKDTVLPTITITNPTNGQTFTAGQSIPIAGTISDDKFLAEVHVHVSNTNTGALLMDVHIYPNGTTSNFSESITAAAGVNYRIQVLAKDRAVNEAISTVNVSCN